jgi:hypothetical protein
MTRIDFMPPASRLEEVSLHENLKADILPVP